MINIKKKISILLLIVFAAIGAILIYNYIPKSENTSNKSITSEYTLLEENNVFVYKDLKTILKVLNGGTGIVFLGFKECPWCQQYVVHLNNLAKKYGSHEIYYYDIKEIRSNNTSDYQNIVSILNEYLPYDDNGNKKVMVPIVIFMYNGEILGVDYETATFTDNDPNTYWTTDVLDKWSKKVGEYFGAFNTKNSCTNCNK